MHIKRFLSVLLSAIMTASVLAVTAAPASAKSGFSDVAEDRWSAASIQYAVDSGYMKGVGGDRFDPEGSLTRAMVATVLWRREGEPKPTAPSGFSDVPAGEWYADAVAWAKETGVVKGITEKTFEPDGLITREQLATMLFRFSSSAPVSVPERADLTPFSDDEKVSDWANEPLGWAVEAGLIKGTDGNRLAPEGDATREQFAAIVERYDGSFKLAYNEPVLFSHYTEPEYPLVDDADFYVSTAGDDNADGSFDHPFRTWERARDAVRALDKTGRDGVKVAFFAGDYGPLDLTLSAEDSGTPDCPITYCKYGDGDVVFSGGVTFDADDMLPLTDEEKELFNPSRVDRIRKIDLDGLLPSPVSPDEFVLFDEDTFCVEARFPNRYADGTDAFLYAARTYDDTSLEITNVVAANRLAKYADKAFGTLKIYGYVIRGYRKDTFKVAGYDPDARILSIANWYEAEGGRMRADWTGVTGNGIEICFANAPYELDSAHEYWLDPEENALYVYDPQGKYGIPLGSGEKKVLDRYYLESIGLEELAEEHSCMIEADGVGFVTFRGLDFKNAEGEFIYASHSEGIVLDGCSFRDSTGYFQVLFDYCREGRMTPKVVNCDFDRSFGAAIIVHDDSSGPDRYEKRDGAVIDNCRIAHANLTFDVYGAVIFDGAAGGVVSHCLFEECSRCAVTYTDSYDILIEYNDFAGAMCNSQDGGVVYSWGNQDGNCVIRYNLFRPLREGAGVGRLTLYADDGECGTEMYSNLIFRGHMVVFAGAGRDNRFSDNAAIQSLFVSVQSYTSAFKELGESAHGKWPIYIHDRRWAKIREYCETVPGYAEAFEARRPGILSLSFDVADAAERNFYLAPANEIRGNVFVNGDSDLLIGLDADSAEYCDVGNNSAYTFNENPVFVNPTLGDYRIREGADFPDIHFEKIGRY
ncbi:MAG: S-layer homology domain-containing protein [Clostridia bacterium]|nr:S-layer homology domain-containing protein [Clostridia bacterium]